jgi:hypothetical protein
MSTLFSDNFDRADSTNLGASWNEFAATPAGGWQVLTNRLVGPSTNQPSGPHILETTTAAMAAVADVQASVTRVSGASYDGGPMVRKASGADTCYYLDVSGTNVFNVYRRVAGVDTLVGGFTQAHADGDTYTLAAIGSGSAVQLGVYRNGSLLGVLTDSSAARLTAAGQVGVVLWSGSATLDNFLAETPTPLPPAVSLLTSNHVTTALTNYPAPASGTVAVAANMLLIAFAEVQTQTATDWVVQDNISGAGGWTKIRRQVKNASADILEFWVRNALTTAGNYSFSYQHATGSGAGGGLTVLQVTNMSRAGAAAVRSQGGQDNQALGTAPAPVLNQTTLSVNPTVYAVLNATSPATMTPAANWTEDVDAGFSTPATGIEVCHRNSGFAGTTITGGSNSGSAYCSLAIELDAGAPAVAAQTPGPPFPGLPAPVLAT